MATESDSEDRHEVPGPKIFPSLDAAIASPEGLRCLYHLQVHASFEQPEDRLYREAGLNFETICYLSEILFRNLETKFEELFLAYPNIRSSEDLTLLLRCCITNLGILGLRQDLVEEGYRSLLSVLARLLSVESREADQDYSLVLSNIPSSVYKDSDSPCSSTFEDFSLAISILGCPHPHRVIILAILEIFADELLMNKTVRKAVTCFPSGARLFVGSFCDLGCVLEVLSTHFVYSFSAENASRGFIDRLYWKDFSELHTTQMSLSAALSLLLSPAMFSAPKMFHSYFVSLVSDTIGVHQACNRRLDLILFNYYLKAFEKSVYLYTRQMCNWRKDGHFMRSDVLSKSLMTEDDYCMDFEHLITPSRYADVSSLISRMNGACYSYFSHTLVEDSKELLASSILYIKESLRVFGKCLSEETLSEMLAITSSIALRSCSTDTTNADLHINEKTCTQDLYFLASILKLMSCSMLQVLCCLSNGNSQRFSGDGPLFKGYEFFMGTVEIFQKFSLGLPVQSFILKEMEAHLDKHARSKWMLLHFSGLLSLSFASGLDFLVKGCIFAIVMILYLFIFEEGGLQALRPISGLSSQSPSRSSSCSKQASGQAGEAVAEQESHKAVALKFQKIRTLCVGGLHSGCDQAENPEIWENMFECRTGSTVSIRDETSSEESFVQFMRAMGPCRQSDIDDLADFVECKPGRDYRQWLKNRELYRRRRLEKAATYGWKRKKAACRGIRKA